MSNPERRDPRNGAGNLIDSECKARYHWAAQAVAGKVVLDAASGEGYGIEILAGAGAASVSAVDIDASAVSTAKQRFGEHAAAIEQGDLRELPFPDDRFDVVVCLEAIERVEWAPRAVEEMRRVLNANGLLIISSPSPDVHIRENEHQVHEFRLDELAELVETEFSNVAVHRQDAWLGPKIEPTSKTAGEPEMLGTSVDDGGPASGIVLASEARLPELRPILAVGNAFDARPWSEQLIASQSETKAAVQREEACRGRLVETADALLNANQELAQIPLLRHRLATIEAQQAELSAQHAELSAQYAEISVQHAELSAAYHGVLASRSWKITAPLRRRP